MVEQMRIILFPNTPRLKKILRNF